MNILSFFRILFLTSFKCRNNDPRDISLWRAEEGVSVEIDHTRYAIDFSVPEIENGYLLRSPPFVLRPGVHEISLNVATTEGACSLGVLDVRQDNWICFSTCEFPQATVIPRFIAAGVLGIARMMAQCLPNFFSK